VWYTHFAKEADFGQDKEDQAADTMRKRGIEVIRQ